VVVVAEIKLGGTETLAELFRVQCKRRGLGGIVLIQVKTYHLEGIRKGKKKPPKENTPYQRP
jgi:hypothetical protein